MASYLPHQHPLVPRQTFVSGSESDAALISSSSSRPVSVVASSTYSWEMDAERPLGPDQEWVMFSPNEDLSEIASVGFSAQAGGTGNQSGAATPLAFPTHDGVGSFSSDDINERIIAWRINQPASGFSQSEQDSDQGGPLLSLNLSSINITREVQSLDGSRLLSPTTASSLGDARSSSAAQWGVDEAVFASAAPKPFNKENMFSLLHRKIVEEFIGIDDRVMQLILGEAFIDPDTTAIESKPSSILSAASYPHYDQARVAGPKDWDRSLITKVFNGLGISKTGEIPLFKYLGDFIERYCWESPSSDKRNYWEAERYSAGAETNSVCSGSAQIPTAVW